jgi:hypothetical protein
LRWPLATERAWQATNQPTISPRSEQTRFTARRDEPAIALARAIYAAGYT